MSYINDVPALLTVTEFAKRCGVSRTTATKIIDSHPEYVEQVEGGQRFVKAGLLFSFYDNSGSFVELDESALKAADASV